jgi:ribonuclease P protein component
VKREYSLKGRENFRELFAKGRRFNGKSVRLMVLVGNLHTDVKRIDRKNDKESINPKIGVVVYKKYGNAVQRNRAKRRIRAICSQFLPSIRSDCNVIISPKERFRMMSYNEAVQDVTECFQKAGILRS